MEENLMNDEDSTPDFFDSNSQEKIKEEFEIAKIVITMDRTLADSYQVIDFYNEVIRSIKPMKDLEEKCYILNQDQFRNFVKEFELKLTSKMLELLKPKTIDFFLHAFYIGYHEFMLPFNEKEVFYHGLKLLIKSYPFISDNYDISHRKFEELSYDKFCYKDFISFQNFAACYVNILILRDYIDFIESVHFPLALIPFEDNRIPNGPAGIMKSILNNSIDFLTEYSKDFENYLIRIHNSGVQSWSNSSFLERMYSNMVHSATDIRFPKKDKIPPSYIYSALKSFEKNIIRDYNFTAHELTSIITGFLDMFNDIYKARAERNDKTMFFTIISTEDELERWFIPYVKENYESGCNFLRIQPENINWFDKTWQFLDGFSINNSNIDISNDLFSQEKIPFAMEFHNRQYFVSSVQFITAFGELVSRYSRVSGKYSNVAGNEYEQHVKVAIESIIPQVCTRVKLENVNIARKTQTDIDIVVFFAGFLFLFDCKAYSRINYRKELKLEEIEENLDELKGWLLDIDNVATWAKDHLDSLLDKVNSKLAGNKVKRIEENEIKYIVPCVISIATEFILDYEKIGWLYAEGHIPRCCSMREITKFFEIIKSNSSSMDILASSSFVIPINKSVE